MISSAGFSATFLPLVPTRERGQDSESSPGGSAAGGRDLSCSLWLLSPVTGLPMGLSRGDRPLVNLCCIARLGRLWCLWENLAPEGSGIGGGSGPPRDGGGGTMSRRSWMRRGELDPFGL